MESCPYCSSRSSICFSTLSSQYMRCPACDLIYRAMKASYYETISAYPENRFNKHSSDRIQRGRDKVFRHILGVIELARGEGRLLDVGCGYGRFLVAAQRRGWQVEGIEPSFRVAEIARQQNGLAVYNGTLNEYCGDSSFDAITFINVLDHSAIPWMEIKIANRFLRSGGLVYLRFPNGLLHSRIYLLAHKYRIIKRVHKFLVFHQYSFTPRYIKNLLDDHGFAQTTILNSPPSEGDPYKLFRGPTFAQYVKNLLHFIARYANIFSRGRLLLGPSLEVTAIKKHHVGSDGPYCSTKRTLLLRDNGQPEIRGPSPLRPGD